MFYKENRPWGNFEVVYEDLNCKIKKITVNPNSQLSYQYHLYREEFWTIIEGKAQVVLNDKIISLEKGSSINIPKKSRHRIINKEKEDLIFIEVQTGESFEEVDIVRIEDHYKRTSPKIILVSGGFDPIHSGHIEYFKEAKKLGDFLCVALNSDQWLVRKKGQYFMTENERASIIKALKPVDMVISFDDSDNTSKDAIKKIRNIFPLSKIIFANGGDRTKENIPEKNINIPNIDFVFGVGGEFKKNSSSEILKNWETWLNKKDK